MPPRYRRLTSKEVVSEPEVSDFGQTSIDTSSLPLNSHSSENYFDVQRCDSAISSLSFAQVGIAPALSKFSGTDITVPDAPRSNFYTHILPIFISGAKGFSCPDIISNAFGFIWLTWMIAACVKVLYLLNDYYLDPNEVLPEVEGLFEHHRKMVFFAYLLVDVTYPLSFGLIFYIHKNGDYYIVFCCYTICLISSLYRYLQI
jgi:hypothetical protein